MTARVKPNIFVRALIGVVASAAGLGLAHLLASLFNPGASPIVAVGSSAIDLAPRPLKDFAVSNFGEYDKIVLVGSVMAGLLVITAGAGVLAFRSLNAALVAVLILGAVGGTAALTRGDASPLSVLPALVVVVVGGFLLRLMVLAYSKSRSAGAEVVEPAEPAEPGATLDIEKGAVPVAAAKVTTASTEPATAEAADADAVDTDQADDADAEKTDLIHSVTSRRGLLLGGSAGLAVAAAGIGEFVNVQTSSDSALGRNQKLPTPVSKASAIPSGAMPNVKGITPFVTKNSDFYRVDVSINTPRLSVDSWKLKIGGMVDNPVTLTYKDLLDMDLIERWITISCVSNPVGGPYVGNAKWLGVKMTDIAKMVGINKGADQWLSQSSDGYTCGTPLKTMLDGRDSMIAVGMNDEQLPIAHGFPARQIVPGLFGFVSATKWVVKMTATTYAKDEAYWTARKWATNAPTLTQTRIDVPQGLQTVAGGTVTLAGTSWAQHRGVKKVELSIDNGPWVEAKLATDAGKDVWRQWSYDWPSTGSGRHDVKARTTQADGQTQVDTRTEVFPKGATGWPTSTFTVK